MYIGKQPQIGNYQACDSISATATDTFNLTVGGVAVSPISAHHCLVSLNGILQAPITSYTIVGSTIVFASALTTSDSIDFITILGNTLDTGTPSDGTVTNAKLAQDIISGETELASEPADTDEFLVSDAGTLKRLDYSLIKPAIVKLQSQTASSSSAITFSSTYITTTYKKYYLDYTNVVISSDGGNISATVSADNGSSYTTSGYYFRRIYSNHGTSNNSEASSGGTGNSSLVLLGTGIGIGTSTDEHGSGRLTIFDPFSADSKLFISEGLCIGNSGELVQQTVYQGLITSTTINNIKIEPNTGTIVSGTFTLYGVAT